MIKAIVQTETRCLWEVGQDDAAPLGAIEATVNRNALTGKDHVYVCVHLDDPDVVVEFQVRAT